MEATKYSLFCTTKTSIMKLSLLLILFIPLFLNSQISGKKSSSPILIFDSLNVKVGDTIYLGTGSDRKGDFVSIYQPPNVWAGIGETSLPRDYAGKFVIIKHFKTGEDKRTGKKSVGVANPWGGFNFIIDFEQGVRLKEIISINRHSFEKKEQATVVVNNKPSVADELSKLKKLYDDGVLTKEEYDAQKKKLLDQ